MDKLLTLESSFEVIARNIIAEATPIIQGMGYESIVITSARRPMVEQAKLYAQGRTSPGNIVTNAPPGSSAHNYGKAFDFVFIRNGKADWQAPLKVWEVVGEIAKKHGCIWGGNFSALKDYPHIEHPSWKDDRASWRKGQLQIS